MKINLLETKQIIDFEKELPVELVINERSKNMGLPKYWVSFEHSDVMNDGLLIGTRGDGETIDEALQNYCLNISGKQLALFALTKDRVNIHCPNLIHTNLLEK